MGEKVEVEADSRVEASVPYITKQTTHDLDQTFWYVQESSVGSSGVCHTSASDFKALRHKIDWNTVPMMSCCYTMQFIDKVLLNVSRPIIHFSISST